MIYYKTAYRIAGDHADDCMARKDLWGFWYWLGRMVYWNHFVVEEACKQLGSKLSFMSIEPAPSRKPSGRPPSKSNPATSTPTILPTTPSR